MEGVGTRVIVVFLFVDEALNQAHSYGAMPSMLVCQKIGSVG